MNPWGYAAVVWAFAALFLWLALFAGHKSRSAPDPGRDAPGASAGHSARPVGASARSPKQPRNTR